VVALVLAELPEEKSSSEAEANQYAAKTVVVLPN
jgi:hypothetical protein